MQRLDLLPKAKIHPLPLVQTDKCVANPGAQLPFERRLLLADHRYVQAAFAQAGGNLHPNKASTQNDRAFAAFSLSQDRLGVRTAPQQKDVLQMGARQMRQAGVGAGSQQSGVVGQRRTVSAFDLFACGVQPDDLSGTTLNPVLPVERLRLQRRFLGIWLARERVFAQDGAVVWHPIVLVEHDHPAVKALLPQCLRGQCTGGARPDDHEQALIRRRGRRCGRGGLTDQHALIFDCRGVKRQAVHRRRVPQRARADTEGRLVPGTDDPVAITDTLRQRGARVRAGCADSVDHVAIADQQDFLAVGLDRQHGAVGQIGDRSDIV